MLRKEMCFYSYLPNQTLKMNSEFIILNTHFLSDSCHSDCSEGSGQLLPSNTEESYYQTQQNSDKQYLCILINDCQYLESILNLQPPKHTYTLHGYTDSPEEALNINSFAFINATLLHRFLKEIEVVYISMFSLFQLHYFAIIYQRLFFKYFKCFLQFYLFHQD